MQQSGAELLRPSISVKLFCKASGYTFTNHNIRWIKHRHGQGLEWIRGINSGDGSTAYNKFKGKATLTSNKSSKTSCMQFNSLISEDSEDYYCERHSVVTSP